MASELFHGPLVNLAWENGAAKHSPGPGDILVTVDTSSVAQVGLWEKSIERRQLLHTNTAAWLIHVTDLQIEPTLGMVLPQGWRGRVRVLATYKLSDGGLWVADPLHPKLMPLVPEARGLGSAGVRAPSSQNVFVIMHTNNTTLMPSHLQAEWWRPEYDHLSFPNVWVLGVWDYNYSGTHRSRNMSVWRGGRGAAWNQDGEIFTTLIPAATEKDHIQISLRPGVSPVPEVAARSRPRPPMSPLRCLVTTPCTQRVAHEAVGHSDKAVISQVTPAEAKGALRRIGQGDGPETTPGTCGGAEVAHQQYAVIYQALEDGIGPVAPKQSRGLLPTPYWQLLQPPHQRSAMSWRSHFPVFQGPTMSSQSTASMNSRLCRRCCIADHLGTA